MIRIAILASGSGSNAEKIAEYFQNHKKIRVAAIVTNNPNAGVIDRAKRLEIPTKIIPNKDWTHPERVLDFFQNSKIDLIVLAGFLRLIPGFLVEAYPRHIVNIHPALLPAYGGKGMYGMNVHRAVCDNKETESGITIHLVNEEYDRGEILFQARCPVDQGDHPEEVQRKVQVLEHRYYPMVVEYLAGGTERLPHPEYEKDPLS